jgi:hypothetical protein
MEKKNGMGAVEQCEKTAAMAILLLRKDVHGYG